MDSGARDEHLRIQDAHWWHRHKRDVVAAVSNAEAYGRALEIGSGGGSLASDLRQDAFVVTTDIRREFVKSGGVVSRLPDLCFKPGSFDLVILSDVIEHLDRPVESLTAARAAMAPGGRIVITVPAWPALWSDHDVFYGHVKRYTPGVLREELGQAGFAGIRLGWIFALPLLPAAVWRVARRFLRGAASRATTSDFSASAGAGGWINDAAYRYLSLIELPLAVRWLLPAGLTCMATARNPR